MKRDAFTLPLAFPGELIIDNFAGGGGTSTGLEAAFGRPVDIAINHDPEALAMHAINHPHTQHLCESVWDVDPIAVTRNQPVGLVWLSPDCKHFSKAKGGTPVSKHIRGLAWVGMRWAALTKPRVLMLENVEEFQTWGPLLVGADGTARPDPARRGKTFESFVRQLRQHGYTVDWKELRACDYGTPTIRKRLFLVARRDGLPIVWPDATHAEPTSRAALAGKLAAHRTAAECIDFTLPAASIFGRAKPLAVNTQRRVAKGLWRHVLASGSPFIVGVGGRMGQSSERSVHAPMQTITSKADSCVAQPVLAPFSSTPEIAQNAIHHDRATANRNHECGSGGVRQAPAGSPADHRAAGQEPQRLRRAIAGQTAIDGQRCEGLGGRQASKDQQEGQHHDLHVPDHRRPDGWGDARGSREDVRGGQLGWADGGVVPASPDDATRWQGAGRVHLRPQGVDACADQSSAAGQVSEPQPAQPDRLATPFLTEHANASNQRTLAADEPLRTICAQVKGGHFSVVAGHITKFNTGSVGTGLDEPLSTITAGGTPKRPSTGITQGMVAAHMVTIGYGERQGQDARTQPITKPLGTAVAGGIKQGIVAAHLVDMGHGEGKCGTKRFSHGVRSIEAPLNTITASGGTSAIAAAYLEQANGGFYEGDGRRVDAPTSTITSSGAQQRLVTAYAVAYYSSGGQWQDLADPMRTLPTKGRMGLVQVVHASADCLAPEHRERARQCAELLHTHLPEHFPTAADLVLMQHAGQWWALVDITLRMLKPKELFRAQGFPANYVIHEIPDPAHLFDAAGHQAADPLQVPRIPLSTTAQVRMCGNSVCPPLAEALARANFAHEALIYGVAA